MKYYDDEYEVETFVKFSHRKGKKKKGHQSRSGDSQKRKWEQVMAQEDDSIEEYMVPVPAPVVAPPVKTEHQFGDNTHEIKGVKIDFDGVDDIQKVNNVKNNVTTFGIKFFFKGKKGLYRIIWYNTNERGRDATYNKEYAFWLSLKK